MTTILNELEALENDDSECNYDEISRQYKWIINTLEHRREVLQKQGARQ